MVRYFDEDRFEIFATRDIAKDEELLHTYISLKWRTCFQELNDIVHQDDSEHKTDAWVVRWWLRMALVARINNEIVKKMELYLHSINNWNFLWIYLTNFYLDIS